MLRFLKHILKEFNDVCFVFDLRHRRKKGSGPFQIDDVHQFFFFPFQKCWPAKSAAANDRQVEKSFWIHLGSQIELANNEDDDDGGEKMNRDE